MKYIIILLIIGLSPSVIKNQFDFEIHFQEVFKKDDTTTLIINNCEIFKRRIFNPWLGIGWTGVSVKGYFKSNCFLVNHDEKIDSIFCSSLDNDLTIKVQINNKIKNFQVNLKNGKYIGISKINDTSIIIKQTVVPFKYE